MSYPYIDITHPYKDISHPYINFFIIIDLFNELCPVQ